VSVRRLIATVALAATVAGCTRIATQSAGDASGNAWTHHGLLRIVDLSEPDTLNPLVGNQQIDSDLAQLWGGFFFNYSDRNEFVPELATEVPTLANGGISSDGKTIVYHLRRGVTWQDGVPFDARDVVFSWHAIMNPKNNVPSTVGYDDVARIDVRDPYTIAVHLKAAYAPFVASFFAPSGTPYPVLPAHLLAKYDSLNQVPFNSRPIGTGPFSVERWTRGQKIVFHANPHYWRGAPKLREIWYSPVPDENTIVTLLQSHEADLEYHGASDFIEQFSHIPGYRVELTPFTEYGQLALNTSTPFLGDVRVRKALWYAIDVDEMIRDITHGVNVPGHTDQPEFSWAYNPNATHYPYDPAKAKALLEAAGWKPGPDGIRIKDGRRLTLTIAGVSGSANGNAVDVFVQRAWHDVGIEANVKLYTSSLFFSSYGAGGIVQTGKFDVGFFAWLNGVDPDDSTLFMCGQIPPHGQNVYRFCNKDLDAAERVALASNDRATRKRAYATIQAILADQVPLIIPWYARRISVENTDLRAYRPAHAVTSFWNPYEWSI
jgi:peptide/nickel transport system substrate-binding protein